MLRLRLLPVLLLAAAACSDTPPTSVLIDEPEPELESIPGVLVAPHMLRSGEVFFELVGAQTALFKDLVGAEVLIDGLIDPDDGALVIHEFMVLTVDGLPAVDGKLDATEGGFTILPRQGPIVFVAQLPDGLMNAIGKRVWLTLWEGVPVRYGILEM